MKGGSIKTCMEYSLTTHYTPGPNQPHQDVGTVKVSIEGSGDCKVSLKPGQTLMEAALVAMQETSNFPSGGKIYWDGMPDNEPCTFISFDPQSDHLTVRLK
jgi:hypothetical protein